jgi:tetratricopeptide (TPR) repeat protein
MSRQLAWLLAVLAWTVPADAADVEQRTSGWCSPAINGSGNQVVCQGVDDPRAMARLEELLNQKDHDLREKIDDANEWVRKYNELNAQLTDARRQLEAKGEDATLVQTAQDLLHEGKLDDARKIYDRLIASDEANVDRAAEHHFARAIIFALQFRMVDALRDYALAYRYSPQNLRYASGYAGAALSQRQYTEAERGLTAALQLSRDLAAHDPGAYQPAVADTLNSLGVLYRNTGRLAEAEKAYNEALTIWRDLAAREPGAYKPGRAETLDNLGNLYRNTSRPAEAEKAFREALTVYRLLAGDDPGAYRLYVALILNNLGGLYIETGQPAEAEKALSEALPICRDLAARNPRAYQANVAATLNNLGVLYIDTDRTVEAEKALSEALTIRRDLAAHDPRAFQPDVARTLNNLAALYIKTGQPAEAENALRETLTIRRDLAAREPEAYRPYVAVTLQRLGDLYSRTGRLAEADKAYGEAMTIIAASRPTTSMHMPAK